jgi:iduronate 2-sulfatase
MKYQRWQRDPNSDPEFANLVRKHYAACVSYSDALVGRLLQRLDQRGLRDNTVIVLWGDHGWHLGEHAIWGKHALFEESLRSPLIVGYPGLQRAGEASDALVESIDLFPTLCELATIPVPDFCHGTSLVPVLKDPNATVKAAAISYFGNRSTIRTPTHRLVRHADGFTELYDHTSTAGETVNVATKFPELVDTLAETLKTKLELRTAAK